MRARVGRIIFVITMLLVMMSGVGLVAVQTPQFKAWVRDRAVAFANKSLEGELSVGSLHGNWLTGMEARDVTLTMDAQPVIQAERAQVRYRLFSLLSGHTPSFSIAVTRPVVHLERTGEGLNVARIVRTNRSDGPRSSFRIPRLTVHDGLVTIGDGVVTADDVHVPRRLEHLEGTFAIEQRKEGLWIDVSDSSFEAREPDLTVRTLSGEVSLQDSAVHIEGVELETPKSTLAIDLQIERKSHGKVVADLNARPLHLQEWTPFVPVLARYETLSPTIDVHADGPLSAVNLDFDVTTHEGRASGEVEVDAAAPRVRGRVKAHDLNLAAFVPLEERTVVSGDATIDGVLDDRTLAFDGHVNVFGGRADARGTVTLPDNGEPRFDIAGRVHRLDARRLPERFRPPAELGPISLAFNARANESGLAVDAELDPLRFAGATIEDGTHVSIRRANSGHMEFAARGQVRDLDVERVSRALGFEGIEPPAMVPALHVSFDLSRASTGPKGVTVIGTAAFLDSPLRGVNISDATVDARVEDGAGFITAHALVMNADPGALSDRAELAGQASGAIDASVNVTDLGTDAFEWRTDLNGIATAAIGGGQVAGVLIDRGWLSATYAGGNLHIQDLNITGPDLLVTALGDLSVERTGNSSLTYVVDTPPLSWISTLPINMHGEARIEGTLTGNRSEYRSEGKLRATEVGYGNYGALGIEGAYRATVPDLDMVQANLTANLKAIRVEIGQRLIREVSGEIVYESNELSFDGRAADDARDIDASGRLELHPEHREVHLERLSVGAAGSRWTLRAGTDAAIQYGDRGFRVIGLALESDQGGTLIADGGLGTFERNSGPNSAGPLTVSIRGLALGSIADLVVTDRELAGSLDTDATIAGSIDEPIVAATLTVNKGRVAGFVFDRLQGDVGYKGGRVADVDLRLDAVAGAYLTARGRVPLARDLEDALDVRIESPKIDLSVLAAITPQVTDATGTVAIDVRAMGSLDDPRLEGLVTIQGGALTLTALETRYTGLQTDIELTPEMINVPGLTVMDSDGDPLRIAGKLAYRGASEGQLALIIESTDFDVMDNSIGRLEVGTDLHLSGRLTRLFVGGSARIDGGTIDVDELIARFDRPYSTRPAAASEKRPDESTSAEPSGIVAEVQLQIPDTLRIVGDNLRPPGRRSSPGIGDINITIGGDVYLFTQPGMEPLIIGEVHPVRGAYEFQGRQFELERDGTIAFDGLSPSDPRLDVVATRLVSGVETRVHVGGTLRAPTLALSSDPPLEQADILSLIVFNQPVNMLGTGERVSLARRGASVAAGFVTSQLAESVSDALEIDVFDVDIGASTLSPAVTIGEQFGQGLFLKLRQQFGSSSLSTAVIEYRLTDFLRFEGELSHGDQSTGSALLQHAERGGVYLIFHFGF